MNFVKKSALLFLSVFSISLVGCNNQEKKEEITISMTPTSIEMYEEDYALVTAETNSKKQITFVSENNDIVSVSSSGVILAKNAGETFVKAMVEDVFATCTVLVKPISEKPLDTIKFEKSLFVMGINEEVTGNVIEPTFYHNEQPVYDKTFEFTSLDESVATVSSSGEISIINAGTTSIMVSCDSVNALVVIEAYDIVMRTTDDWISMLKFTNDKDARFILSDDLDFTGIEYSYYSGYGNNLMGELNGNGHTVSNITMKANDAVQSIFGYATVFKLSNIRFINTTFTSLARNGGLFTSLYQHYSEGGATLTGESVISNVLCDFIFSDVVSCVIASAFYGASVDNVYAKVRNVNDKALKASDTYLLAYSYYTWYGKSHFINIVGLVENGSITKQVKKTDPSDELYYPDTITEVKTDVTSSLIEANYIASLSYDTNIWNIQPDELPSFIK